LESAAKIIEVVTDLIRHFSARDKMVVAQQAGWPLSPEITLSITALAFTLRRVIEDVSRVQVDSVQGGTTILEQRFVDAKWCP
jgi:hypothetical protein